MCIILLVKYSSFNPSSFHLYLKNYLMSNS